MPQDSGTPDMGPLVSAHEFVQVPLSAGRLGSYLRSHLPAGSTSNSSGTASGGVRNYSFFQISFPANGPTVYLKVLNETWTARTVTTSWLRIDAAVSQVGKRTSSETVLGASSATVTGYASSSPSGGTQGPSSIVISGAPLGKVVSVFDALPLGPTSYCMENTNTFSMTITLVNGTKVQAIESQCGGYTVLVTSKSVRYVLSDSNCSLLSAVVNVLPPGEAAATRSALSACEQ
jgi:hypothetical protein